MTTDMTEQEAEAFEAGFEQGAVEARAGVSADLRRIIDYMNAELRALRIEVCRATGQPEPPPFVNGRVGSRPQ